MIFHQLNPDATVLPDSISHPGRPPFPIIVWAIEAMVGRETEK